MGTPTPPGGGHLVDEGAAGSGFLGDPVAGPAAQALYDDDLTEVGYVTNVPRLWAHQPAVLEAAFDLIGHCARAAGLTFRQRSVLVAACASTIEDSYCSLAWGFRLAGWARRVARDANGSTAADVTSLRAAGFDDAQVLALTAFVALRMASSTVNDALGARPDPELAASAPPEVLDAVPFGRRPGVTLRPTRPA